MAEIRSVGGTQPQVSRPQGTIESVYGFGQTLDALLRMTPVIETPPQDASSPSPAPRFTARASAYMEGKNLKLDNEDLSDLSAAIDTLSNRGAKEGLILMDAHAFLVNISRREVVSAMSYRDAAGTVFPQVDATISLR